MVLFLPPLLVDFWLGTCWDGCEVRSSARGFCAASALRGDGTLKWSRLLDGVKQLVDWAREKTVGSWAE